MSAIKNWRNSWHDYLRAHAKPATRLLHYLQTIFGGAAILFCAFNSYWVGLLFVIGAILINALIAHFVIERNKPAAFGEPVWWSIASDIRLTLHFLTGTLQRELNAAGVY